MLLDWTHQTVNSIKSLNDLYPLFFPCTQKLISIKKVKLSCSLVITNPAFVPPHDLKTLFSLYFLLNKILDHTSTTHFAVSLKLLIYFVF